MVLPKNGPIIKNPGTHTYREHSKPRSPESLLHTFSFSGKAWKAENSFVILEQVNFLEVTT